MRHVLVETNWVVAYAAPEHHQIPAARELVSAAQRGECALHVPALCLAEARRTIQKFQPRHEANAIRRYLQRTTTVSRSEAETTLAVLTKYESSVLGELRALDDVLRGIRELPGVHVFALDEAMLERSIALSVGELSHLQPFDQCVLASVLVRAEQLREQGETDVAFCELDADLQPWDKNGDPKPPLVRCYDAAGLWVFRDFELSGPARPSNWPAANHGASEP